MTLDAAQLEAAGLLDGVADADARRERLRLLEQLVAAGSLVRAGIQSTSTAARSAFGSVMRSSGPR